ncbi:hypothetical protein [Paenibacillus mucilaginosus]|uniref:Uncharacterized protein n=1 Tax=Paenibacillus mucilaginosus (strain KNP414) TaxID=1036673 RepID=F8F5A3_PAEMK|nr:hypothetical protein [Paenibacillus mucilaginosus]AEI40914.1 hypothetical protein KNP414_02353 [Paenibacillus mucilaginosus KNP414]MCG7211629.1 hypothetical protein [Paenibacillus mucilaginosus]WDM30012.1 hypothetical protein KCX80_13050 [Paenibacillus mucilaginosus]
MMNELQIQEVKDDMARQYRQKTLNAAQIVTALLALKLAGVMTEKTMQSIIEEIVRTAEIPKAVKDSLSFAKKDKKTMRGLIDLAKERYGSKDENAVQA